MTLREKCPNTELFLARIFLCLVQIQENTDQKKLRIWTLFTQCVSTGTHWIALYVNDNNVTYFDSLQVDHTPKEIRKFIGNKNITTNIYRIQTYDSIICGYFCIGFIDFMLKGKSLLKYINLFSPNDYEKNDKIILKYFL